MPATYTDIRICLYSDETLVDTVVLNGTYLVGDVPQQDFALDVNGWSPAIAKQNLNAIGGSPKFENVIEEFSVTSLESGTSADGVGRTMQDIARLEGMFRTARQYAQNRIGFINHHVRIEVHISKDNTLPSPFVTEGRWVALVLDGEIEMPPDSVDQLDTKGYISGIKIRVLRRGQWTTPIPMGSYSLPITPGEVYSFTINYPIAPGSAAPVLDSDKRIFPLNVKFTNAGQFAPVNNYKASLGYMVFACPSNAIMVIDSIGQTSDQFALGGEVFRLTSGQALFPIAPSLPAWTERVAIFASYRNYVNLNTPVTFDVQIQSPGRINQTRRVVTNAGKGIAYCGDFSATNQAQTVLIKHVAGNDVDIDYVAVVALNDMTHIIRIDESALRPNSTQSISQYSLTVAPYKLLTPVSSALLIEPIPLPVYGDTQLVIAGSSFSFLWMATGTYQGDMRPTTLEGFNRVVKNDMLGIFLYYDSRLIL